MSKRFSERILDFLRRPEYAPMKAPRLAQAMGIAEAEHGDFHDAVDSLRRVGRVVLGTGNAVMLPHPPNQVVGTFRGNPRGFGFVVPDGVTTHGDLFIPPDATAGAVTGDKVLCAVQSRGMREGKAAFGGRVLKIIERGDSRYVGELRTEGGLFFVQPDGNMLHAPIVVGDVGAKGAKAGEQVVVEIIRYPSDGKPATGVIVERLGKRGQPGVDLVSIKHQYHLPDAFPKNVLAEARGIAQSFDADTAIREREDLSDTLTITIDPDDAKDYDDAISLTRLDGAGKDSREERGARRDSRTSSNRDSRISTEGGARKDSRTSKSTAAWELGVHIADVSTFVCEGEAIDTEAVERGTSVYFPGHVVPMLPEVLSNGLCSLQEGEPRLCKSAFIRYDAHGKVVGARFANTVIRSSKRLTYRQATAVLDGQRGGIPKPLVELVERMDTLARIIQARRHAEGMIVLDLPAVDLILDDDGRVVDAEPEDKSFSHTIIEMFMVEANEAVARLMDRLGVPCLRRIHPDPDEGSLEAMARFMRAAGFSVPKKITPRDLQKLLEPLRGKPEAYAINLAVLKSMEMAEYSPKMVGHFALASRHYAHFTSPIRRYPDLMVHRLLEKHFRGGLGKGRRGLEEVPSEEELIEAGRRMSYLSRRAEAAEQELRTVKVLELLSQHVGEEFEGVVTGVTNFGLFVQHPKYLIDGLLRVEDLGDDWWEVDVKVGRVVGERTRRMFTMGTLLKVRIGEVDVAARQLGLILVGAGPSRRQAPIGRGGSGRHESRGGRGKGHVKGGHRKGVGRANGNFPKRRRRR